jgi:oxalate decarboxylase
VLPPRKTTEGIPQPQRPGHGGTDHGPRNLVRDRQNPDMLVPPSTDHGTLPNLRFSFSDAHMRLETGGWTRQVTERELGISKNIAGVNMRLNRGGVRELHWHKAAEWAYMLYGNARITAVDAQGRNFVDDVGVGDLWYFPSGIPHSLQGLEPDGAEFLLVFDDSSFDEDNTFMVTDWFKHTPNDVLAKNFGVPASSFGPIPRGAGGQALPGNHRNCGRRERRLRHDQRRQEDRRSREHPTLASSGRCP